MLKQTHLLGAVGQATLLPQIVIMLDNLSMLLNHTEKYQGYMPQPLNGSQSWDLQVHAQVLAALHCGMLTTTTLPHLATMLSLEGGPNPTLNSMPAPQLFALLE